MSGVNRSTFRIPKMDCASEEQLVRMALDGVDVVAAGLLRNTGTNADLAVIKYLPEPGHALLWGTGLPALLLLDRLRRRRETDRSRPAS